MVSYNAGFPLVRDIFAQMLIANYPSNETLCEYVYMVYGRRRRKEYCSIDIMQNENNCPPIISHIMNAKNGAVQRMLQKFIDAFR